METDKINFSDTSLDELSEKIKIFNEKHDVHIEKSSNYNQNDNDKKKKENILERFNESLGIVDDIEKDIKSFYSKDESSRNLYDDYKEIKNLNNSVKSSLSKRTSNVVNNEDTLNKMQNIEYKYFDIKPNSINKEVNNIMKIYNVIKCLYPVLIPIIFIILFFNRLNINLILLILISAIVIFIFFIFGGKKLINYYINYYSDNKKKRIYKYNIIWSSILAFLPSIYLIVLLNISSLMCDLLYLIIFLFSIFFMFANLIEFLNKGNNGKNMIKEFLGIFILITILALLPEDKDDLVTIISGVFTIMSSDRIFKYLFNIYHNEIEDVDLKNIDLDKSKRFKEISLSMKYKGLLYSIFILVTNNILTTKRVDFYIIENLPIFDVSSEIFKMILRIFTIGLSRTYLLLFILAIYLILKENVYKKNLKFYFRKAYKDVVLEENQKSNKSTNKN